MKLSELRPCDNCGGKITPIFYVVRVSPAVINEQEAHRAIQSTEGMFGGSLQLAEAFSIGDDIGTIAMDEEEDSGKHIMTELYICLTCYPIRLNLAELAEKVSERKHEKEQSNG